MLTKPISWPETDFQARNRSPMGRMGVSDSTSSSISMDRRDRLSTIRMSWPFADKWRDVGQPQKPSPPRIMIFIAHLP